MIKIGPFDVPSNPYDIAIEKERLVDLTSVSPEAFGRHGNFLKPTKVLYLPKGIEFEFVVGKDPTKLEEINGLTDKERLRGIIFVKAAIPYQHNKRNQPLRIGLWTRISIPDSLVIQQELALLRCKIDENRKYIDFLSIEEQMRIQTYPRNRDKGLNIGIQNAASCNRAYDYFKTNEDLVSRKDGLIPRIISILSEQNQALNMSLDVDEDTKETANGVLTALTQRRAGFEYHPCKETIYAKE